MNRTGAKVYMTMDSFSATNCLLESWIPLSRSEAIESASPHSDMNEQRLRAHLMSPLAGTTFPSRILNLGINFNEGKYSLGLLDAFHSDINLTHSWAIKRKYNIVEAVSGEPEFFI